MIQKIFFHENFFRRFRKNDSENEKFSLESTPGEAAERFYESGQAPEAVERIYGSETTPEESAPIQFYFDKRIMIQKFQDGSEVELRRNGTQRNENASTYFTVVERLNEENVVGFIRCWNKSYNICG